MIDVAVVGGGLSGLVAAAALSARGVEVAVLEAAQRPGGRIATEDVDGGRGDTGAQFFTVRGERFARLVARWRTQVPLIEWGRGFAQAADVRQGPAFVREGADGHPRYAVPGGMALLGERLTRGLDVRLGATVAAVSSAEQGFVVRDVGGEELRSRAVLCTAPVPQSLALLGAGGVTLPDELLDMLRPVAYDPAISLLLALDRPSSLPAPGGVQFAAGPVRWLGDNAAKGVSDGPTLTAHAVGAFCRAQADADDDAVADALLGHVGGWLGRAQPLARRVVRWTHALPLRVHPDPTVVVQVAGAPLVMAGDAFAGPRIEGAATSGLAAADALLRRLRHGAIAQARRSLG